MVAEARLKSKNLYKVELYLLKIMPMVIALAYLVNTVCIYNKYLICACKVIYLLHCMGVKFYITLHCLIIS